MALVIHSVFGEGIKVGDAIIKFERGPSRQHIKLVIQAPREIGVLRIKNINEYLQGGSIDKSGNSTTERANKDGISSSSTCIEWYADE